MQHIVERFAQTILEAGAGKRSLRIRGGGTKDFYGGALRGDVLDTRAFAGIVDYEPTELVMTARAGTALAQIDAALCEHGQMLAFEPPHFGQGGTLGGCIAAGLSGPRRPYAGSVRDVILGVRILDGKSTDLRFGGQVMKNVAGYDVSRLMAGSLGTLGLLLEASLKVLPRPAAELTLRREQNAASAVELMNGWAGKPFPISATCHHDNALYVRLAGAEPAVRAARERLGGDTVPDGPSFWQALRDHQHAFFGSALPLWRLSIKSTSAPLTPAGNQLIEWNGALRWLATDADPAAIRETAVRAGGHATLFRAADKSSGAFHPLPAVLMKLHQRIKETFDPHGILNPGRLYPEL